MANSLDSSDTSSNYSVIRVSRDGEFALAKDESTSRYRVYGIGEKNVLSFMSESDDLASLAVESGWRRAASEEVGALTASIQIDVDGDGDFDEPGDINIDTDDSVSKPFRAPQAVKEAILDALDRGFGDLVDTDVVVTAERIALDDAVSVADVQWILDFFNGQSGMIDLHGGFAGKRWAEKILGTCEEDSTEPEDGGSFDYEPYARYDFEGSPLKFFACGQEAGSTLSDSLVGIDFDEMTVFVWDHGFRQLSSVEFDDFEAPSVILIDPETASFLAKSLDDNPNEPCDILDACPDERNLFDMAEPDLDYEEMDRVFSIIADATGYSPAERSHNAKRQMRNTGGMFDGAQIEEDEHLGEAFKKAELRDNPPIISDAKARIDKFLENAVTASAAEFADAGDSQITSMPSPDPSLPAQSGTANKLEGPAAEPGGSVMYFAIVDPNDATAVLEMVAITKDSDGNPAAWVRQKGQWVSDPNTLAKLQSATPPPVVELDAPDPALDVIKQVDEHAKKTGKFPTDAVPGTTASIMDAEDLVAAVEVFSGLHEDEQIGAKHYIRRRARALNRMDLIPLEWRSFDPTEAALIDAQTSDLFGPHGEVLVAAGHPIKGHEGVNKLRDYWCFGKGAAKIRWGTPGDLTRAHTHLAKFVGDRAWALAQSYHQHIFGMSNTKHDKLTGQYVSHGKK
jgi:hypothetical protein